MQLLTSTSQQSATLVIKFPFTYGQYTALRCWVDNTKFGQRYMTQYWNSSTNKWSAPTCKESASIILLFLTPDTIDELQAGLPYTRTLDLNGTCGQQDIRAFCEDPEHIFFKSQQNYIEAYLRTVGDMSSLQWQERPLHMQQHEDSQPEAFSNYVVNSLGEQQTTATKRGRGRPKKVRGESLKVQIFRAYTKHMLGNVDGWESAEQYEEASRAHIVRQLGAPIDSEQDWPADYVEQWNLLYLVENYMFDLPYLYEQAGMRCSQILSIATAVQSVTKQPAALSPLMRTDSASVMDDIRFIAANPHYLTDAIKQRAQPTPTSTP